MKGLVLPHLREDYRSLLPLSSYNKTTNCVCPKARGWPSVLHSASRVPVCSFESRIQRQLTRLLCHAGSAMSNQALLAKTPVPDCLPATTGCNDQSAALSPHAGPESGPATFSKTPQGFADRANTPETSVDRRDCQNCRPPRPDSSIRT